MYNVQTQRGRDRGGVQQGNSRNYHVTHDLESAATLTNTLTHALADVMGIDATDAEVALSASVDPDALDWLFKGSTAGRARSQGHVAFNVSGYLVTVYSNGQIVITLPARPGA